MKTYTTVLWFDKIMLLGMNVSHGRWPKPLIKLMTSAECTQELSAFCVNGGEMLGSLSLVILVGLLLGVLAEKCRLPRIVGLLIAGILIGPYAMDLLDESLLGISAQLRQIALIIILLRAGLSLDLNDLKKVGRSSLLMAFVPACFEILAYTLFAPPIFGISRLDALIMGSVLGAVSPAVVVPRMVKLIEEGYGVEQGIPQMILAGASCDDVFVIVLFTTFTNIALGGTAEIMDFINIPISIITGILIGLLIGSILSAGLNYMNKRNHKISSVMKVMIVLGAAFGVIGAEEIIDTYVAFSGLLAVMAMGCIMKIKCNDTETNSISATIGKLWSFAEVFLFVLVGAEVNISYTFIALGRALLMILIALIIRGIGVVLCVSGTKLTWKERLFCVIAYMPKATVQAAIGALPLAMGLGCGTIVLSVAVVGILVTAPLGAIGIDRTYKKLLAKM